MASTTVANDSVKLDGTNESHVINVITTNDKCDNPTKVDHTLKNYNSDLMNIFKMSIREIKTVVILEPYSEGLHKECKSECQRIMQEYLTQVRTYDKIKSVMDLIDKNITLIKNASIDGVDFLAEDNVLNSQADNKVNGDLFHDDMYKLLADTYDRMPCSTWTCQYRKSELVQHRGQIMEQLTQSKTTFQNTAVRLNEFLSKLMKYKAQKSVFDFVFQRLDAL